MYNVYTELPRLSLTEFQEMQEAVDREVVRNFIALWGAGGNCFLRNQHVSHYFRRHSLQLHIYLFNYFWKRKSM